MSQYEFYEYREQERGGEVSRIDVVCKRDYCFQTLKVLLKFNYVGGAASFSSVRFLESDGDNRELSGINFDLITRAVAIAVQKIEERGYDVDSPFEHESLEAALEDDES